MRHTGKPRPNVRPADKSLKGTSINVISVIASAVAFSREAGGRGGRQSSALIKQAFLDRHVATLFMPFRVLATTIYRSAVKKIKARLTELTGRELTAIPLSDIVGNVNRNLRGWANYFHYRNSSLVMSKVRNHAEDRLRTHLMKRHKVKDRGTGLRRFPSADLYGRYGLYKVPAVAGWRSAHAVA